MWCTKQEAGTASKNAGLECTPVTINEVMQVHQVVCDGAGFWIATKNGVVASFPDAADAIGYVLKPGVYMAYPNLKQGQTIAKVEVRLVPQPAPK